MRTLLVLVLSVMLALPAAAQSGEQRRYFKDWLASCRADGYCSAIAYVNPGPGGGADADYWLRVGRHAREIYWEVSFTTIATQADPWSDFTVSVDGDGTVFSLAPEVGAYGAVNDFYLLGDKVQGVMDRMAPGSTLSVSFRDTEGRSQMATFSLAGLTAALLWIDETQNRIGSERVAGAPPVGLVPVGPGAEAPADVPAALLDRQRRDPECEPLETLANGRDLESFSLEGGQVAYFIPCWSAAYNFGWKVYTGSGGDAFYPQYFASYGEMGWTGTPFVVNYAFDPATLTITDYAKARGLGDCGTMGTWVWDTYAFRLTEFRYQDCETGPTDQEAEITDFPVVYAEPLAARAPDRGRN